MPTHRFNMSGKTALITGSAGLLGIEHAAALLECECAVVLTDISETELMRTKNQLQAEFPSGQIFSRLLDVTNPSSIENVYQSLNNEGIEINILINNAAVDPKITADKALLESSRLEHFPKIQWELQLAVGLTGAFLCSQVFGTKMAEECKGGVILNIASDLSVLAPDQRLYQIEGLADDMQPVKPVTYSVIKAGLLGLTRYLATYWADKGVRSNALSPGGVFNGQHEEFVQRLSRLIPMGRMANKDEYRAAIQFLCSDASSYMNGQNVVMDGGRSVL